MNNNNNNVPIDMFDNDFKYHNIGRYSNLEHFLFIKR